MSINKYKITFNIFLFIYSLLYFTNLLFNKNSSFELIKNIVIVSVIVINVNLFKLLVTFSIIYTINIDFRCFVYAFFKAT